MIRFFFSLFLSRHLFREQCRWVQMHTTNMCFNSHLHSNNRRKEKLTWTTLNGHFLPIYTILNLQTVPVENGLPMEMYTHIRKKNKIMAKHIEVFFQFELKKNETHTYKTLCDFHFVLVYHSDFSGFSIWSSRPDCNTLNRAQNPQFPTFIFVSRMFTKTF